MASSQNWGSTPTGGVFSAAHTRFPCSKLKLDNLFLQWLSFPDSQKVVGSLAYESHQWVTPYVWAPLRKCVSGASYAGAFVIRRSQGRQPLERTCRPEFFVSSFNTCWRTAYRIFVRGGEAI
jgi:hypothetical protein